MQKSTIALLTTRGRTGGALMFDKYLIIRDFIVSHLDKRVESTILELLEDSNAKLSTEFHHAELGFQVLRVKGDLEARGIIRTRKVGQFQKLRLMKKHKGLTLR